MSQFSGTDNQFAARLWKATLARRVMLKSWYARRGFGAAFLRMSMNQSRIYRVENLISVTW